jgi:hypothetical protein
MEGRSLKRVAEADQPMETQSTLVDVSKLSNNPVFLLLVISE